MSDFKFKPGDRVTERPRVTLNIASTTEGQERYGRHGRQRYGTVTGTMHRTNVRGSKRKFISVLWDGHQKPSEHEQMRLCAIEDLSQAMQSVFNGHAE